MYLNVFYNWRYLQKQTWKVNATLYTSSNVYWKGASPDDGQRLDKKYLKIYIIVEGLSTNSNWIS